MNAGLTWNAGLIIAIQSFSTVRRANIELQYV